LHKNKQTLKIIYLLQSLKVLPTNLDQKQNAPPTFSMEKEGGACKGFLRTTTKEGITNLTKKNPTHPPNY